MLVEYRDYVQTNISVTTVIYCFSQVRGGAGGGRATEDVAVTTLIDAVIIIMGAIGNVDAVDFGVVITFAIVRGCFISII